MGLLKDAVNRLGDPVIGIVRRDDHANEHADFAPEIDNLSKA